MRFLGAKPKNISVLTDIDLSDLRKVKWSLEHCSLNYDGEVQFELESAEYFSNEFYTSVCELIKYAEAQLGIEGE